MKIQLDMYQTLAAAVLVLLLGNYLKKKIYFLQKFCIPAPVIGGLIFAIMTCICYVTGIAEFSFDDTLREVCMVFFFTSVGFQANLKVLKSGGKSLIVFLGLVIALIILQNLTAVGLAKLLNLNPLIGMCTGSIPMVGGHGTAGAFGSVLEDLNIKGATTICTAAATFGLIFGSLIGGPLGKRLIEKHNLLDTVANEDDSLLVEDEKKHERHTNMYADAVFQLILAIGVGTIFTMLLTKTGLTFPIYIGAMLAAALMRNICEYTGIATIHMGEINDLGGISLSLPRHGNDHTKALGACITRSPTRHTACSTGASHNHIHVCYRVQHHGARLRCSHTCIRHLRLRNRSHAKRHGKYAGCLRPICAIHQGISAHTARGKPVC